MRVYIYTHKHVYIYIHIHMHVCLGLSFGVLPCHVDGARKAHTAHLIFCCNFPSDISVVGALFGSCRKPKVWQGEDSMRVAELSDRDPHYLNTARQGVCNRFSR